MNHDGASEAQWLLAQRDNALSTVRTLHGKRVSVGECGSQGTNLSVPAHYRYKVGFAPIFAYEGVQEHAKVRGGLFRLASVHQFSESLMSVFHQPYSFVFIVGQRILAVFRLVAKKRGENGSVLVPSAGL
jgi:hypothetical protein